MKKFIFLFVFLWLGVSVAKSVDPNCLWEVPTSPGVHYGSYMYDAFGNVTTKVYIDTCGVTDYFGNPIEHDSITNRKYQADLRAQKRFYAKEVYNIVFKDFPSFPFDTTGKNLDTTTYLTVDDIKQEYSEIRDSLLSLSNSTTGEMRFYRSSQKDKTYSMPILDMNRRTFYISFENLVNAIKVEEIIDSYDGIDFDFRSEFAYPVSSVFEQNDNIQIYPNPATGIINIEYPYNVSSLKLTTIKGEKLIELSRTEIAQMNSNGSISIKTVDFSPGVYFVIIDNQYFEKLIIQP